MKTITILLLSIIMLSSCNFYLNDGESKIDSKKETNAFILSELDTSKTYHILIIKDELYAVNKETNLVEYKIRDYSMISVVFFILTMISFIAFSIALQINNEI